MRFTATLELHGKTATGIRVPDEVVQALAAGNRPAVVVTLNGHAYRTTVAKMGGRFLVPVAADVRTAAAVAAGDELDVGIELDTAPRTVDVPDALAVALSAAGVRDAFDAWSGSRRKEAARSIDDAKTDATRERRIAKVIESLS